MATRERVKADGTSFWEVYWRNPFTKKLQAKTFQIRNDARRFNEKILHHLKYKKEYFRPKGFGLDGPVNRFSKLAFIYLETHPQSATNKKNTAYHLQPFYEYVGNPTVESIDEALMKQFERRLKKPYTQTFTSKKGKKYTRRFEGRMQSTVHTKVCIIKTILDWGVKEGYIPGHNLHNYRCPKGDGNKLRPPSLEELKQIRKHAAPHVDRAIFLGFNFGLRVGGAELYRMTWGMVDFDKQLICLPPNIKGDGEKGRQVDIRDDVLPVLKRWKDEDDQNGLKYLVHYNGRPVNSIKTAWKGALRRAGITRRIRPFDLRHAFATEALTAGATPKAVAEIMGHVDVAVVHRYYRQILDKQKKAAVDGLPSL